MQRGVKIHVSVCQQHVFLWYAALAQPEILFQTDLVKKILPLSFYVLILSTPSVASMLNCTLLDYPVALSSYITCYLHLRHSLWVTNREYEVILFQW